MKLRLTKRAWQKIQAYVDNCEYEIGGLGKVTCDGEDFVVTDAEIFTQKVTAAHVDLTAETLAKFQTEKIRARESMKDYKFWWHSHAKMDAFFSGTDTNTIDTSNEFPWLVSFVTNHAHKKVARLDIYEPVHVHIALDIEVIEDVDQELIDACKAEIAAKVTTPPQRTYFSQPYRYQGAGGHDHSHGHSLGFGSYLDPDEDMAEQLKPIKRKLSKAEKRRLSEIKKTLQTKEKYLCQLEKLLPSQEVAIKIDEVEEEIADLSVEIDYLETGTVGKTKTITLPTPKSRESQLEKLPETVRQYFLP